MLFEKKSISTNYKPKGIAIEVSCKDNIININVSHNGESLTRPNIFCPKFKYRYTWFDKYIRKITKKDKMERIKEKHRRFWVIHFQEDVLKLSWNS